MPDAPRPKKSPTTPSSANLCACAVPEAKKYSARLSLYPSRALPLLYTSRWLELPIGICQRIQRFPAPWLKSCSHAAYRLKLAEVVDAVSLGSHQRFAPCDI